MSYLWPAACVYGCHPAWRCTPASAGWGARGMRPTHDRRPGEVGQGCGVSGGGPVGSLREQERGLGGLNGPGLCTAAPQGRRSGPVAGGRAWGCRGTNSIARRSTPCQAASVRGQSNQVLSEVLRAGRESTAGLSLLSTPDSILMWYVTFGENEVSCGVAASFLPTQRPAPTVMREHAFSGAKA